MSTTENATPGKLVYSPDDHGYYFEYADETGWYVSKKVYPSHEAAMEALSKGEVEWVNA